MDEMLEFLVTADVLMNDITDEAKTDILLGMQESALAAYLLAADSTGLEPTLLRHWYSYGAPGLDYGDVALWMAPDEGTVRDIYARLPLVKDSRMTVAQVTLLHATDGDNAPRLRGHNRHGAWDLT